MDGRTDSQTEVICRNLEMNLFFVFCTISWSYRLFVLIFGIILTWTFLQPKKKEYAKVAFWASKQISTR